MKKPIKRTKISKKIASKIWDCWRTEVIRGPTPISKIINKIFVEEIKFNNGVKLTSLVKEYVRHFKTQYREYEDIWWYGLLR